MRDDELRDTAADPLVQAAFGRKLTGLCSAVLGPYPASGYQFEDNDRNARCAFNRPCPIHDKAADSGEP